jgi:hypothetical protein
MSNNEEPEELTYDEAVALLPDGEEVHTVVQAGNVLIGADWSRASILELLRTSPRREVTGPAAQAMGHGLAAVRPNGLPLFIETRNEES